MGLWNDEMKNRIIAHQGSIQNIPNIPADMKAVYKTVWEISQKVRPVPLFSATSRPTTPTAGHHRPRRRPRRVHRPVTVAQHSPPIAHLCPTHLRPSWVSPLHQRC